jgi:hypothetical protein
VPKRVGRWLVLAVLVLSASGTPLAQGNCETSQAVYDSDQALISQPPPTLLRLMSSRYVDLGRAARGMDCTGVPLVAFDGLHYRRAGGEDDPGLFYFVPRLARALHLSLATTVDLTLTGTVLVTTAVGMWGFLLGARTVLARRVGVIAFLLLTMVELVGGDIYVMNAAPAVACVPWILYFASRRKITAGVLLTFGLAGVTIVMANFFRAYAGMGLALFAVISLTGFYAMKPAAKIVVLAMLLVATAGTQMFLNGLYRQRSAFLGRQRDAAFELKQIHPFWHSVYIGLGYVKNSEIPAYSDSIAATKVQLLRPNTPYLSKEYEQVLKGETLDLARRRPWLILENVFVKLVVVLGFCIAAANVGLYAAGIARKPFWLELAFLVAIAFNSLFGILVVPSPKYLLGMIAFAVLYGAYSIGYASEQPQLRNQLAWLGRIVRDPAYRQQTSDLET